MAPITALLYCYRLPSLSSDEFRDYIEQKHVPLVLSLLGSDHPKTHTRYYTSKESGYAVGSPSAEDADLMAVLEFESEEAMQKSMRKRSSGEIGEQIKADEQRFMNTPRVKLVVLGKGGVYRSIV